MEREHCKWLQHKICKARACVKDCSLANLQFEKEAIQRRVIDINRQLSKLSIFMDRRKDKILDLIMGRHALVKALKEHFDVEAPDTKVPTIVTKVISKMKIDINKQVVYNGKTRL